MSEYFFTIPGEPRGQARARSFAKVTKSGQIIQGNYTPEKTRNYEAFIKERFLAAYPNHTPIDGALFMSIVSFFPIPASASKKNREEMLSGRIRPTKKPDNKNILATVEDALNGIAYVDDKNIVSHRIRKYYGETPRVDVQLLILKPF